MADPVVAFVDVLEGIEEVQAINVIFEDRFLLVASGGDMIDCTGIFDAEGTRHGQRLAKKRAFVNSQDLTL
jgi:hypothetical protein